MKLPVDVRALYEAGKRLKEDRDKPVRIAVLVEVDAPDALVEAAKDELHPRTANGIVDVAAIEPGFMLRVESRADAAIVLAGSGATVTATLRDLRERAIPTAVVALRDDAHAFAVLVDHPDNDVVVGSDAREVMRGPLAEWAMDRLEGQRAALGHNFEFMRRAVAKEIVKSTAWQNAAIGVVVFVPGADMPLMTLNQGRMLLQIAAAYGEPLDSTRVKELAAVVGGGFLFRTFARELVGLVPGFGWAVKGSIAYTGTIAMGMAAIAYFEKGLDLSGVLAQLSSRTGEAAGWAAARLRRGGREELLEADLEELPAALPSHPAPARASRRRDARGEQGYTTVGSVGPVQGSLVDVPPAGPTLTVLPNDGSGPRP